MTVHLEKIRQQCKFSFMQSFLQGLQDFFRFMKLQDIFEHLKKA